MPNGGGSNFFESGTVAAQKPPARFPRTRYSDSVSIFNPENHFVFKKKQKKTKPSPKHLYKILHTPNESEK